MSPEVNKTVSLQRSLNEYKASHRNRKNVLIHMICVPLISVSTLGMLKGIPAPFDLSLLLTAGALAYCAKFKNWRLLLGIVLFFGLSYLVLNQIPNLFLVSLSVFVVSWVGQFIGHAIEGKQPAFVENLESLFLGPIWVLSTIFPIEPRP
jgi:uncharacterized membrane protein YGL010W